jgi:predicted Zn finger-like uncharacterized protein
MIVTCPNCRSRYAVDPQAIGAAGRTVECARCHHRWLEKIEAAAATPELVIRPTTPGAGLPAIIPPKPAFPWQRLVAVGVALVVLLAAAMFAFRHEIAAMMAYEARASTSGAAPAAASAPASAQSASVPWPARPPAAEPPLPQIEIDVGSSKIDVVDGRYVVRGQLVNNGTAAGSTTLLRLIFKRNDDVLGERSFAMVAGPLPPGGRTDFSQPLDDPPVGTTDIVPLVE